MWIDILIVTGTAVVADVLWIKHIEPWFDR